MDDIIWEAADGSTTERCQVIQSRDGVRVSSDISGLGAPCAYELQATSEWQFLSLSLRYGDGSVEVIRTQDGWSVDGRGCPDLAAAYEVDIAVSPFSNTLPIRRLRLATGQSADIVTAYVTVPELAVVTDPQRYTRLADTTYLYESRDSDFRRTITVDGRGLVVDYPGLFQRAVPG